MTHTPLTKAERDHLTLLHTAARDPMSTARERATAQAQLADQLVWTGRTDPMNGDLPRLLADLDAAEAERDAAVAEHTQRAVDQQNATAHGASWWPEKAIELRAMAEKAVAQRDRAESELDAERRMRVEAEAASDRMVDERDALKAKLADPRRVLIHETEVVATKEEIASLKTKLNDLSEADEELHTCRALVNATSENLSVDLERMVDDLAEANEKAARSEKDSHSWYELYKDAKAKLAALVEIHPFHEWGDDDGPVIWWSLPICEPPFHAGYATDSDWPWDDDDMRDAEFTAKIGWSRMPHVEENTRAAIAAARGGAS